MKQICNLVDCVNICSKFRLYIDKNGRDLHVLFCQDTLYVYLYATIISLESYSSKYCNISERLDQQGIILDITKYE